MPFVLVVDDSEIDRRLVGGLLSKDVDWLIEFADNGVEALDKMSLALPDVVITDMMMPRMDGMELVSNIRVDYPQIPIILITGHGSETLAVEALHCGATSYVPKSALSEKLLETVEQVLALRGADRKYDRLIECLDNTRYMFSLSNDLTLISPLVDLIQQMLAGMHCCDSTERMHAAIALEEALLNAILHGNLEMDEAQVQQARQLLRQGVISELVKQRCSQTPYQERQTQVHIDIYLDRAVFVVRDQGPGFDTSQVPRREDTANVEKGNSRGLVLIQNFMESVEFNEQGNELTLTMSCHGKECRQSAKG